MTAHTATETGAPFVPGQDPDQQGFFGPHGGCYVPDPLLPVMREIADMYALCRKDPSFQEELDRYLSTYTCRPTPLFLAENLTRKLGGAKIYLKREDLNHLGAHKLNNCLGQILLAKRMGKKEIIAETGAGQHGVASAAAAALMGMTCKVFMGEIDVKRQQPNVLRMQMMGAEVVTVTRENGGLKEAVDEAIEFLMRNPAVFYLIGSAVGPHPYPLMVRNFQSVVGKEIRTQCLALEGRLPDMLIAAVGGGSNAIGMFHPFINDVQVKMVGVEPGGRGSKLGDHAATLSYGSHGVVHGYHSYVLKDENGEVAPVHSISAGLDYPGVGPEHAMLRDAGRAGYAPVSDLEALDALFTLSRLEGIIPALESAHALAYAVKTAPGMPKNAVIVVNLSGRGDKDMPQIMEMMKKKT